MEDRDPRQREFDAALDAFRAGGCHRGAVYLSTPITTGWREAALLDELSIDRPDLRSRYRKRWLKEVVFANEETALDAEARIRAEVPAEITVVNPAHVRMAWSQSEYEKFWDLFLTEFPVIVMPLAGWELSSGALAEIRTALTLRLPILNPEFQVMSESDISAALVQADFAHPLHVRDGRERVLSALKKRRVLDDSQASLRKKSQLAWALAERLTKRVCPVMMATR